MLNRRHVIAGAPVLIASTCIGIDGAQALSIGGAFKRVATTVVQGLNFVTNPAAQVAAATKVLAPLVREVSPEAGRAVDMVQKIAEQNSTLEARLRIIANVGLAQGLPIFANTGFQQESVPTFSEQSARPLQLSSSLEDELRADPFGYVQRNAARLTDHVNTFPSARYPATFLVGAGDITMERIPAGTSQSPAGYFSSVLTIGDILKLVSIFRGA